MPSGHIVSLEPRASEWSPGGLRETLTCSTWFQRGSIPCTVNMVIWQGISRASRKIADGEVGRGVSRERCPPTPPKVLVFCVCHASATTIYAVSPDMCRICPTHPEWLRGMPQRISCACTQQTRDAIEGCCMPDNDIQRAPRATSLRYNSVLG